MTNTSPVAELAGKFEERVAAFVKEHRLPGASALLWAGAADDRAAARGAGSRTHIASSRAPTSPTQASANFDNV